MKFLKILCYLCCLLPFKSFGSHGLGGEVTWTCLGNGQFKFQMKFYRDCNGITPGLSLNLTTNVPGLPSIPMSNIAINDVSHDGFIFNGTTVCPACSSGSFGNPIPGLVEEYIYESAAVTLQGTPPATGWVFSWGECCMSSLLTNLVGGGSLGFKFRAIMYPNGQNTSPCFDSSPFFIEKPALIRCTGNPEILNYFVIDSDNDSLAYELAYMIDDAGNQIPFAPGYSVNSQLPGIIQNPANVNMVLNGNTGEISYTSHTSGYFMMILKVKSYKQSILVSEITRACVLVLSNDCDPILGGGINHPPDMSAPFFDPVTGLQTAWADTVFAGDTVSFDSFITDLEFFTNGSPQIVNVTGYGSQFGAGFSDPATGCNFPPCATVTQPFPITFATASSYHFNWVTSPSHIPQGSLSATYNFLIDCHDNYCPANGFASRVISITVQDITIGSPESVTNQSISIYPNPSTDGEFFISNLPGEDYQIEITDIRGMIVYQKPINTITNSIDLTNQSCGIYFVKILSDRNPVYQKKLIRL
jgi:hypothetical protein